MRRLVAFILLALPLAACADGAGVAGCVPKVSAPWIRMAPAAMPMGAGFAVIRNPCGHAVAITGIDTPDFSSVSLHRTVVENGVSRMRPVDGLAIEAGSSVQLRPGGLHLMLMQPTRNLEPGKLVRIDFRMSDGRTFGVDFPIRDSAP